jgi:hypothetical protein
MNGGVTMAPRNASSRYDRRLRPLVRSFFKAKDVSSVAETAAHNFPGAKCLAEVESDSLVLA